ncbi:hypothetical protein EGW08_018456, partial [Elysia chlorotica]
MFYRICCCVLLLLAIKPRSSLQIQFKGNAFFQIDEDTNIGTKIGNFTVIRGEKEAPFQIISTTNFVTINTTNLDNSLGLAVDVFLNTKLDTDYGKSWYDLTFEAVNSQTTQNGKFHILVNDVNDEVPEFKNRPYSVTVKEDAEVNSVIYTKIDAFDPDTNDAKTYILSTDKYSPFSLDTNGKLHLVAKLDYESQTFYQYIVTVKDEADHTATAEVFIKVEDVQDTPPEFYRDSYSFTILENSPQGTLLNPAVQARDGDR